MLYVHTNSLTYLKLGVSPKSIAEMEYLDEGQIRLSAFGESPRFCVIVSSNMAGLNAHKKELFERAYQEGAQFTMIVNLFDFGNLCAFAINSPPAIGATERALADNI